MAHHDWRAIVELLDVVSSRPSLVAGTVRSVRERVDSIGRLPPDDVARHTRALLAAASRAIAERRGPSAAELDFIEELATTRARQQIPIEAVLTAIHLAGQAVWQEARQVAGEREVPADLLLDAREVYEQWAEAVRARLIVAHRAAEVLQTRSLIDRRTALLRRAIGGGPEAAVALGDAGFAATSHCWIVHAHPADTTAATRLESALRTDVTDLFGMIDDALVGVTSACPTAVVVPPVGLVGPLDSAELHRGAGWARQAWAAAAVRGRTGPVPIASVALEATLLDRDHLADHVAGARFARLAGEGEFAATLAATVATLAEQGGHVPRTAAALFVHPNTVRHRVRRFSELTGLDPDDPFDLVTAWWLTRSGALGGARDEDRL